MLMSMLKFELKYHFSQIIFKIAAVLFLGLGFVSVQGNFGGSEIHKNAPYVIAVIIALFSLLSIFAGTLFCAGVVLRDSTYKMDSLLFTTGISKASYFFVRFIGLFLALFFILFLTIPGIVLGSFLQDPDQLGPFNLNYFIQPVLTFAIPNVLFVCSILFSVTLLSKNTKLTYATGVLLYVLYLLGSILGNSPLIASSALKLSGQDTFPMLTDPFGLSSFFGETRSWSILQRNEEVFPLEGTFLLNRLLWAFCSAAILAGSYFLFNFRLSVSGKDNAEPRDRGILRKSGYRPAFVHAWGIQYHRFAFLSQLKLDLGFVFRQVPFYLMLLIWAFLMTVELSDSLFNGFYGIHYYPLTGIIFEQLLIVKPAMLLIVFYAAELLGRERSSNMEALVYSSPAPNPIFWAAKSACLLLVAAAIVTVNIGIGIGTQIFNGHYELELPVYLSLYYYSGLPLLLFAVLVVFVQNLVPNKYLGMLINLFLAAVIIFSKKLGIEHFLLRYASLPRMEYSYFNGIGHYARAVNWYMLYWSSFAGLLALLSVSLWENYQRLNWLSRFRAGGKNWTSTFKALLAACLVIWIGSGTYIYYQTNIIGKYQDRKTSLDWSLRYEKKYKFLEAVPQPFVKAVKTQLDIYPSAATYVVKGSFRLKNESSSPISALWYGLDREVSQAKVWIDGTSKQERDAEFEQYRVQLKKPMLPGAEISLQFEMRVIRSGFMSFNNENSVVENGTYIELEKYLPFLGYNTRNESDNGTERKRVGLPEERDLAKEGDDYHLIDYETVISTEEDQYVATIGTLEKSWKSKGRKFFHYKTKNPVNYMFALSSARYTLRKENYKGAELRALFLPGHGTNVEAIMQGMKDALDYGNQHFSNYSLKQLGFAEIPQYRGAATAYAGMLFGSEKVIFLSDYGKPGRFNHAYATVAHETGHQWWVNQLSPVYGPGFAFLTESLAKYTENMVVEHRMGKAVLNQYLKADNRLYFNMRNMEMKELPLCETIDQPFVHYQKGGLELYAIKEVLGENKVSEALQRLLAKHRAPLKKARPADLIAELNKGVSPEQVQFIRDRLEKVITYSLKIKILTCKKLSHGKYVLSLQVNIGKNDLQNGKELLAPVNDWFDIALFDQDYRNTDGLPKPIYLKKCYFNKAESKIDIITDKKPVLVGIDPYGYILDPDPQDNMVKI